LLNISSVTGYMFRLFSKAIIRVKHYKIFTVK
jgi:hypothetical protein